MFTKSTPLALFLSLVLISFGSSSQSLDTTTVASNLDTPWEIVWGPDNNIWITERAGKISRINPLTHQVALLHTLSDVSEQGESGLLGMVLHPDFSSTPQVFLVYTYLENGTLFEKAVRFTYQNGALVSPFTLIQRIRGGMNHDGSRLLILPDKTLLMSTGDAQSADRALDLQAMEGKILRLNLDGTIPADNPFTGSRIWTFGHRNPQGMVAVPDGPVFSSEHGPSNDDEVNIIVKGGNYGWPSVEGFCDQSGEITYCGGNPVKEPVKAWTPTLAVAGIDYYDNPAIPQWRNCIIMTTLKEQDLRVLQLSSAKDAITSERIYYNGIFGRLRDVCISPQGDVYIAVSNRDGRGSPLAADDRIVKISSKSTALSADRTRPAIQSGGSNSGAIAGFAIGEKAFWYTVQGRRLQQGKTIGASVKNSGIFLYAGPGDRAAGRIIPIVN